MGSDCLSDPQKNSSITCGFPFLYPSGHRPSSWKAHYTAEEPPSARRSDFLFVVLRCKLRDLNMSKPQRRGAGREPFRKQATITTCMLHHQAAPTLYKDPGAAANTCVASLPFSHTRLYEPCCTLDSRSPTNNATKLLSSSEHDRFMQALIEPCGPVAHAEIEPLHEPALDAASSHGRVEPM